MNNNNTPSVKNSAPSEGCKLTMCKCGIFTAVCLVGTCKIWFDIFSGDAYCGRSFVHYSSGDDIPYLVFDIANYKLELGADPQEAEGCSMAEAIRFYRNELLGINQFWR